MNFSSIDIQGSILSIDLLSKIRAEQADYQSGKHFKGEFTNPKLKDEKQLKGENECRPICLFNLTNRYNIIYLIMHCYSNQSCNVYISVVNAVKISYNVIF